MTSSGFHFSFRRLFNDRRFVLVGPNRIEQNMSRVLTDINRQLMTENPEVLTQFTEHLQRLSDALNGRRSLHQSSTANGTRQVDAWTETMPIDSGAVAESSTPPSSFSSGQAASFPSRRWSENEAPVAAREETPSSRQGVPLAAAKALSSSDVSVVLNIEATDDCQRPCRSVTNQQRSVDEARRTGDAPMANFRTNNSVAANESASERASTAAAATNADQATTQGRRNSDWNTLAEMSRNAEVRRVIKWLCFALPFLLILFVRALFVHTYEVVPLIVLIATFLYANSVILRYIAAKTNYGLFILCCATGLLLFETHYFYSSLYRFDHAQNLLIFTKPNSWQTLKPNQDFSAFTALWYVLITDCIAKFFTIFSKSMIALAPNLFVNVKRKAIYYQWAETSSHVYRWWLPVLPWVTHISMPTYPTFVQYFLVTLYLVLKLIFSFDKLVAWWRCTVIVLKPTPFGEKPDEIDLAKAATQCSICFSPFQNPTQLKCKHIFCEDCIATWLNKERTCPICRTQVSNEDKHWRDGSTSLAVYFC